MGEQTLQNLASELLNSISAAWKHEAKPDESVADSGCPEDREVNDLFHGLTWDEVDLGAVPYNESMPLIYMNTRAKKYYLQAYLRYCLDVGDGYRPGDTPGLHLIDILAGTREQKHHAYSREQISCIIEFLRLVQSHADAFGEEHRVDRLKKAVAGWTRELGKASASWFTAPRDGCRRHCSGNE
jgi:hypothetical protein